MRARGVASPVRERSTAVIDAGTYAAMFAVALAAALERQATASSPWARR
jgi:hypothetical protein